MQIDEKIIEAAALSDADYDGRPWLSMPRPDRDRYLARAGRSINAALAAGLREQIEREAINKCIKHIADMARTDIDPPPQYDLGLIHACLALAKMPDQPPHKDAAP
jgi:hypothetical protein